MTTTVIINKQHFQLVHILHYISRLMIFIEKCLMRDIYRNICHQINLFSQWSDNHEPNYSVIMTERVIIITTSSLLNSLIFRIVWQFFIKLSGAKFLENLLSRFWVISCIQIDCQTGRQAGGRAGKLAGRLD
jgi:hypothetical protein